MHSGHFTGPEWLAGSAHILILPAKNMVCSISPVEAEHVDLLVQKVESPLSLDFLGPKRAIVGAERRRDKTDD